MLQCTLKLRPARNPRARVQVQPAFTSLSPFWGGWGAWPLSWKIGLSFRGRSPAFSLTHPTIQILTKQQSFHLTANCNHGPLSNRQWLCQWHEWSRRRTHTAQSSGTAIRVPGRLPVQCFEFQGIFRRPGRVALEGYKANSEADNREHVTRRRASE